VFGVRPVAKRMTSASKIPPVRRHTAEPLDQGDPGVAEQADVDGVEAVDLEVLAVDEPPPVEHGLGAGPAEALAVLEVVPVVGAKHEELLGDAAANDAGPADAASG
jgi:hypothetical protein